MKDSEYPADRDAYQKIADEYNAAFAARSSAEKSKPNTVEHAKQGAGLPPSVAADTIPH